MKKTIKKVFIFSLFMLFGLSVSTCELEKELDNGKTISGTVTAYYGYINFEYSNSYSKNSNLIQIITDLPSPNNEIILNTEGSSSVTKIINGLTVKQVYNWTATVSKGDINVSPLCSPSTGYVAIRGKQ